MPLLDSDRTIGSRAKNMDVPDLRTESAESLCAKQTVQAEVWRAVGEIETFRNTDTYAGFRVRENCMVQLNATVRIRRTFFT